MRPALFQYTIDPARGVEITRVAIRAFLDTHLGGGDPDRLKSALAPYPEVEVQTTFSGEPGGLAPH